MENINAVDWSCKSKSERLFPNGEMTNSFLWSRYTTNEHPFLQKLIDYEAFVTVMMGEIVVLGCESMALIHITKDFVNIECISTPVEFRHKGSATKLMKAMVEAAKETGTELRLRACNVTGHGPGWMIPDHTVIFHGAKKKNKIPTAKLKDWYEKFGFVTVAKLPGNKGWNMQYLPTKN